MEEIAVQQAREKYAAAVDALEELRLSATLAKARTLWARFLFTANGVYAKLEHGSKVSATSRQWFGAKKNERKTDPLLAYMRHARNADEHALQIISRVEPKRSLIIIDTPRGKTYGYVKSLRSSDAGVTYTSTPDTVSVSFEPERFIALRVYDDRGARWYEVPDSHKGIPVANSSPVTIGGLFIIHLGVVISEAEELV